MTNYSIEDGLPIPEANKGGRPTSQRLAEIDEQAAKDVINGKFANDCEAAEAYICEYAGYKITKDDGEVYSHKKKDLVKRIRKFREDLQQK